MWYGHRRRFFGGTLRVDYTGQGNDFELIPTVKMETIHPVEGYFCSKFSAICNHFGVMAAWSHKMLEIFRKSKRFWKNNPLQENFQNSVVKVVIATRIDVLSSNFMKFGGQEIGEIVGWLPKKKNSPRSPALTTVWIVPKSARASPWQCTQISLLSAKL